MKKGAKKLKILCILLSLAAALTIAASMIQVTLADSDHVVPFSSISGLLWIDSGSETDWDGLYDGAERPVAGYTVYLHAADDLTRVVAVTNTDANGIYSFNDIEPGSYVVGLLANTVNGLEYRLPLAVTADSKFEIDSGDPLAAHSDVIELDAGQAIQNIDAGLWQPVEEAEEEAEEISETGQSGSGEETEEALGTEAPAPMAAELGSISGFLWADGDGKLKTDWDGLYNANEQPLAGYTVYLYRAGDLSAAIAATRTSPDGTYIFENLEPGAYVLGVDSSTVDGCEYLLPFEMTADNNFAVNRDGDPLMAFTGTIELEEGQGRSVETVDAGMRLPAAAETRAGSSYTVDVNYSAGSLTLTGRGYSYNAGKLSFNTDANGNQYTIIRTGTGLGAVTSIEFPAGVTPASVSFNNIDLTGGITFAADFNAELSFNNVSVRSMPLTLPADFNAAIEINGLTVGTFTLPSGYTEPITFNGITATGGIVYPAGYLGPIAIVGDFDVQGNQFPEDYAGPLTVGGVFTETNIICRPGASLSSGLNGIFLPAHITSITIDNARTDGSGRLCLWLGDVDVAREFTLLLAGSSDISGNIEVPAGTILTIDSADSPNTGSESGTLTITTPDAKKASIGGYNTASGQITINGGTVIATSQGGSAGIGGGGGGGGDGNVTINGGRVIATGKGDGAGIGGSSLGVGNVTINGGTVIATSGNHDTIQMGDGTGGGAGIGGGLDGFGNVTITGGYVTANSIYGAGIGNGGTNSGTAAGATQGSVVITGGIIRGYSLNGANIGKGVNNGYVPTYQIEKEADILMYGRGFTNARFGIQCSGNNQGDAYFVSMYFDERIKGDLYVYDAADTSTLVRICPISADDIIYMSVTFSTGHAYPEQFRIFVDYYNDQKVYLGLKQIVHYYDHVSSGTFLNVKDPIIFSVANMKSYPHNFPGTMVDVLYAYMDVGGGAPVFYRVTERYVDTDGNPIPDESGKQSNEVVIPEHGSYNGTHASIAGCTYKGYKWEPWNTADPIVPEEPSAEDVTDGKTVYFVYAIDPGTADVTVSKVVTGHFANKSKEFTFTVYLTDAGDRPLTVDLAYVGGIEPGMAAAAPLDGVLTLDGGQGTFTLKHGQRITLLDVPADAKIRIVETADDSYNTLFTDSAGAGGATNDTDFSVAGVNGTSERVFAFFNAQKVDPVPTGIAENLRGAAVLPIIAVLSILSVWAAVTVIRKRLSKGGKSR